MTITHWLRSRLLERAGLATADMPRIDPDDARRSQWSPRFERLMRNRLVFGAYRYGLRDFAAGEPSGHDAVGSAIARLRAYQRDGNQEHLVDAANLCLVEFGCPMHPSPRWAPAGEHNLHARRVQ